MAGKTSKNSAKMAKKSAKRPAGAGKKADAPKSSVVSAAKLIDKKIAALNDWRGEMLQKIRGIIKKAEPDIIEEWKWETPVWSHNGIICTGEVYKHIVKMTFAQGASVPDPARLFNSSLEGKVRRAIDIHEDGKINEKALMTLIRQAALLNAKSKKPATAVKRRKA